MSTTTEQIEGLEEALQQPLRIRFLAVKNNLQSVSTQGYRVSKGINGLKLPDVSSEVVRASRSTFSPGVLLPLRRRGWKRLLKDVDILVVVKSSSFRGFEANYEQFRALCREQGVILVSSPADGPGSRDGSLYDPFSENIADYVFSISPAQHEYLCQKRDPATVFNTCVATRPILNETVTIRDRVETVIWENPPHLDPFYSPETTAVTKEEFLEFEKEIRDFCVGHGARLETFGYWRDTQSDEEWQRLLLQADVAIECKGLHRRYTPYQLQKPATKLQNYLALGLPVVCDPVPAYEALGSSAKVMFADNVEDWKRCLERLFESRELRADMSKAALEAVAPMSSTNVARFYVAVFRQIADAN